MAHFEVWDVLNIGPWEAAIELISQYIKNVHNMEMKLNFIEEEEADKYKPLLDFDPAFVASISYSKKQEIVYHYLHILFQIDAGSDEWRISGRAEDIAIF